MKKMQTSTIASTGKPDEGGSMALKESDDANYFSSETKQVIFKLFDAYLDEDMESIKNLLADDIKLIVNSYEPSLELEGIDGVLELVQGMFNRAHITEIQTHEIMSEESKVMVYLTERGVWREGSPSAGDSYEGDRLHIYKVKNDKIIYAEYYFVSESPIPLPGSSNPGP